MDGPYPYPHAVRVDTMSVLQWRDDYDITYYELNGVRIFYLSDVVYEWMDDNISGEWSQPAEDVRPEGRLGAQCYRTVITFEHEADALIFQMKWI